MRILGNPKITLRINPRAFALQTVRGFSYSLFLVFPGYSPSHAARSLTAHDRAKCPRRRARSFDEGIIKSREKRGFARRETQPCQQNATSRFDFWCADNDMMLNSAASTRPPFRLSLKSTPSASSFKKAAAIATALSFLFILSVFREALPFSQVYEIVVNTATF